MGLLSRQPEEDDEHGEVRITGFGDLDDAGPDQVVFDLDDWSEAGRAALDERLHLLEAPHAWEDDSLVVDEPDAAWIERIIEQVEDERAVELDPDAEQIAYDLTGWDDLNRGLLLHALTDEAIAHAVDDDELVVHEIDEQRVDEIVETILEPDDGAGGPAAAGGEARSEIMGELFLGADRLVRDPHDAQGRAAVSDGAREVAEHTPPYGMDKRWWQSLGERCSSLLALLEVPDLDEERVQEQAVALRDALRPYV